MEDLTVDELKQLVLFYKQKSSDLELETLKLQLKLNRVKPEQQGFDEF